MDWYEQMIEKYRRHNQILFDRKSSLLYLLREQIAEQKHFVVVSWCFACMEPILKELEILMPKEKRAQICVEECRRWAKGEIKMPQAKKAILEVHAAAKETDDLQAAALCHAIGQACGSIHTESHAVGLVFYELSAIVRKEGIEHCRETVESKTKWYMQTLQACSDRESELRKQTWAAFLLKDRPNKEAVLLEREKKQ